MFEFGDELIINSYRIPWLIWIQLLAMLLLLILLYSFTATSSDLSTDTPSFGTPSILTSADVSNRHNSKVRENERNERKQTGPSTSEVVQRAKKPEVRPRAESSTTNENSGVKFEPSHHPCHIFGLAKHAFLKCLGIDTTHEKND